MESTCVRPEVLKDGQAASIVLLIDYVPFANFAEVNVLK